MYFKWKVLTMLGFIFWITSYLTDMFFIDPRSKFIKEEDKILFYMDEPPQGAQQQIVYDGESSISILIWSFTTFIITIGTCFFIKYFNTQALKRALNNILYTRELKKCKSKIPIAASNKSNDVGTETDRTDGLKSKSSIKLEESFTNTTNITTNDQSTNTNEFLRCYNFLEREKLSKIQMDKHFAKLREDMITQQTTAKKDQEALQKKIELLSKDKRELTNKLTSINKECKTAKQQIEELINERNAMNKRLENANKEIKNYIKTKKSMLDKLEESLSTIDVLNKKSEQINRDKEILHNKFEILEKEYKKLQKKFNEKNADDHNDNIENNINNYLNEKPEKDLTTLSCGDNLVNYYETLQNFDDLDFGTSQSDIDIQKVQMKLLSLEQSLEKLTIKEISPNPNYNMDNIWNDMSKENREILSNRKETSSNESICVDINCPLEHEKCTNQNCLENNKFATINLNIFDDDLIIQTDKDGHDAESVDGKILDESTTVEGNDSDDMVNTEHEISDNLMNIRTEYSDLNFEEENSETNSENNKCSDVKKGIVSKSPEFQKFMMKILESDILT